MISERLARRFVACGWIAALISAFGTLYVAFTIAGRDPVVLIEAGILIALAFGIYRNSRICAVIALVFFVIERVGLYRVAVALRQAHGGHVLVGFWIAAVTFSILYVLGVVGTITWHLDQDAANNPKGTREASRE